LKEGGIKGNKGVYEGGKKVCIVIDNGCCMKQWIKIPKIA
jgi:hypothetical protein